MAILRIPNQSTRWLLAELLIIVVGILVAFQVEEWRSNLADRASELVALSGVSADLEYDVRLIDLREAQFVRRVAASRELASLLRSNTKRDPELIAKLFMTLSIGTNSQFSRDSYAEMVQEGRLSLIEDMELRREIQRYYETRHVVLQGMLRSSEDRRMDFQEVAIDDLYMGIPEGSGSDYLVIKPTNVEVDLDIDAHIILSLPLQEIPRHPQFFSRLARYGGLSNDVIRHFEIARTENTNLSNQIDAYLEKI